MSEWREIDDDLCNPAFYATGKHHEVFRRLRAEEPVHWTAGRGTPRPFWSITRHADCTRVLRDSEGFSSEHGGVMLSTAEYPSPEERQLMGYGFRPDTIPPPLHLQVRQPFNKYWSVPAIARMREKIQKCVDQVMAEVLPRGACDIVEDIAAQLPARLVCEMMGVPEQDRDEMRETVARFGAPEDPHLQIEGGVHATFTAMLDKIYKYMLELALKRRIDPREDFTSIAAGLLANGERLDDRMLGFWCMGFVVGGLETTRDALSIGFYEFMKNPAQAQLLRDNPALAPRAADEMIRWASPSKYKWRIATRDIEVGGKHIRKGDWVVSWLVSANRDEAVFDHADQFDISRTPNPHLSFGAGDHACIGRHLAHLEIQLMINAVVQHMPDMKISGDHEWIISTNHSGFRMLPVTFTPAEKTGERSLF